MYGLFRYFRLVLLILITGPLQANQDLKTVKTIFPKPQLNRLDFSEPILLNYSNVSEKNSINSQNMSIISMVQQITDSQILANLISSNTNVTLLSYSGLEKKISTHNGKGVLSNRQLKQAYILHTTPKDHNQINIFASSNTGVYYALHSLVQILIKSDEDRYYLPQGKLIDWPEIAIRLAKTSASYNNSRQLNSLIELSKKFKLNMVGLQYHGKQPKFPEHNFAKNVDLLIEKYKTDDSIEIVVYQHPTNPKADNSTNYDLRKTQDREKYLEVLNNYLNQGAGGVSVDLNDWIKSWNRKNKDYFEDFIHSIDQFARKHPDKLILICPPLKNYKGSPTKIMQKMFSNTSDKLKVMWTGRITAPDKLKLTQVQNWSKKMQGKRPFLWINQVYNSGKRSVAWGDNQYVFDSTFFADNLATKISGLNINIGFEKQSKNPNILPNQYTQEDLVYLATAADYFWNPKNYHPADSVIRVRNYLGISGF